jgi:hypothetical protein
MDVAGLESYDGTNKALKQYDRDYSRYPFHTVNQCSQIGIDAVLLGASFFSICKLMIVATALSCSNFNV